MGKWVKVAPAETMDAVVEQAPESVRKLKAGWKKFNPIEAATNLAQSPEMQEMVQFLDKREPDIDYRTGAPAEFRASLSRAGDTRDETIAFLNKTVGPKGWRTDRYGGLTITLEGGKKIGWNIDRDTAIEDRGLTGRDVYDYAGSTGPLAGAVIGGTLAAPFGLPAGMLAAAGGAFLGKLDEEVVDTARGNQRQTPLQVTDDAAVEGMFAAGGEFGSRVLNEIGAKLLGPESQQMTPTREGVLRRTQEQGFKPNFSQVVDAPLAGRAARIAERVMGDPHLQHNQTIARQIMGRLADDYGAAHTMPAIGAKIKSSIKDRAARFRRHATQRYGVVDELFQGEPVVPTARIKQMGNEIQGNAISAAPDPATGEPGRTLLQTKEMQGWLKDINDLPDYVTTQQMQDLRQKFYDAGYDDQLLPGLPGRDARRLEKAAGASYDDITAGDPRAKRKLKETQRWYRAERQRFDDDLIQKLIKDVKQGGVEPEKVVDLVFKRKHGTRINRIRNAMNKKDWPDVQASAMDELINSVKRRTDDPVAPLVLDGTQLHKTMDSYGNDTLNAMFGASKVKELRAFADALQVVGRKMKDQGGLVAAGIAARPLKNFGRIVGLGIMNKMFMSDAGLKYFTHGIRAPQTRAGAAALTKAAVQMEALLEQHTGRIPEVQNLPIPPK